jgi:general secretion pathway protein K
VNAQRSLRVCSRAAFRDFLSVSARSSRQRSRGAALLMAMLTVTLVATFAAAALWQQWRSIEVETAERARGQSAWVLTGALDWARLLLREDARARGNGAVDHLGEPWAVPLQEARLSSFLAADQSNADTGPEVLQAFLSGQIADQQALLNVNNLVNNNKPSEPDVRSFSRLFELLELPHSQLDRLVENIRLALDTSTDSRSGAAAPLLPQQVEQLTWLGIPAATVTALRPFVTLLPVRTSVNLNTASAEVIYAASNGLGLAEAQRLVAVRERSPFQNIADARRAIGATDAMLPEAQFGVSSRFFEIQARLRLDQMVVVERSLLQRDGTDVRTLQRLRGVGDAVPPQTTAGR